MLGGLLRPRAAALHRPDEGRVDAPRPQAREPCTGRVKPRASSRGRRRISPSPRLSDRTLPAPAGGGGGVPLAREGGGGAAGGQRVLQARPRRGAGDVRQGHRKVLRGDEAQPEGPRAILEPRRLLPKGDPPRSARPRQTSPRQTSPRRDPALAHASRRAGVAHRPHRQLAPSQRRLPLSRLLARGPLDPRPSAPRPPRPLAPPPLAPSAPSPTASPTASPPAPRPAAHGVAARAQGRRPVRRDGANLRQGLVAQGGDPLLPQGVPQGARRVRPHPQARACKRGGQEHDGAGAAGGQRRKPVGSRRCLARPPRRRPPP